MLIIQGDLAELREPIGKTAVLFVWRKALESAIAEQTNAEADLVATRF